MIDFIVLRPAVISRRALVEWGSSKGGKEEKGMMPVLPSFGTKERCSRTDWAGETVSLKIREDVVTPVTTSLLDP